VAAVDQAVANPSPANVANAASVVENVVTVLPQQVGAPSTAVGPPAVTPPVPVPGPPVQTPGPPLQVPVNVPGPPVNVPAGPPVQAPPGLLPNVCVALIHVLNDLKKLLPKGPTVNHALQAVRQLLLSICHTVPSGI
jgi:hypothetical protein